MPKRRAFILASRAERTIHHSLRAYQIFTRCSTGRIIGLKERRFVTAEEGDLEIAPPSLASRGS
jgi:hypothetical protein